MHGLETGCYTVQLMIHVGVGLSARYSGQSTNNVWLEYCSWQQLILRTFFKILGDVKAPENLTNGTKDSNDATTSAQTETSSG